MKKALVIMRREVTARVGTRVFVISTILFPVIMAAFFILPALLSRGTSRTTSVAIVDASTDTLGSALEGILAGQKLTGASALPRYRLTLVRAESDRVVAVRDSLIRYTGIDREKSPGAFDGVLVLTDSTLATGKAAYYGDNASALESMGELEGSITRVLTVTRLRQSGIDVGTAVSAMRPADLSTTKVSDGKMSGQSGAASFLVAYVMGFLLYFTMIIYGMQTLTSVIEEKTSRIMEVMVSSVRPFEMLAGKILGVGVTGLIQLLIWAASAVLLSRESVPIAHALGANAATLSGMQIPSVPVDVLVIFLVYFVLGYFLYGAIYAAIGSMFNAVREAQQVASFVQVTIIVGFLSLFAVIRDPTGGLGVALSIVPFFSPFIMPARWSLSVVPLAQLAASLVLAILAVYVATWVAGRIYRTGILMYGKKPSLMTVFRWITAR